jgi:hypothetical protein
LSRSDYIKKAIESGTFLISAVQSKELSQIILGRVAFMVESCWAIEWKSYKDLTSESRMAAASDFWTRSLPGLEFGSSIYYCEAIFNETVNPPGKEGRVFFKIQPSNAIECMYFTVDPIDGEAAKYVLNLNATNQPN